MIINNYIIPTVYISLFMNNISEPMIFNNYKFITQQTYRHKEKNKDTINFNYLTTEDWIKEYIKTYQDIIP